VRSPRSHQSRPRRGSWENSKACGRTVPDNSTAANTSRMRHALALSSWLIFSSRLVTNAWMSTERSGEQVTISETTLAFAITANSQIHCCPARFVAHCATSGGLGTNAAGSTVLLIPSSPHAATGLWQSDTVLRTESRKPAASKLLGYVADTSSS